MKFRLLFRLLPAILAPIILWAGTTGKITGKIIDAETGMPLAGANVVVTGTSYGTAAGADGRYVIMNIPAGTYSLAASMIGYKTVTMTNVQVSVDLTTTQDYMMDVAAIEGEGVIVEATRPIIQQDITASRTIQSGEDVLRMPVDSYEGALVTIAGAVMEQGQVHFRGGRAREIVFLLDNTSMTDPLSGTNDTEVSTFAIQETHTMTGGFSAEYGNAQSGVVNVVTKDGGDAFNGKVRFTTSGYGLSDNLADIPVDEVAENLNRMEVGLSGPVNVLGSILPGRLTYLLTGDFLKTQGRFVNQDRTNSIILAKLTYRPVPQITLRLNALIDNEYHGRFLAASSGIGPNRSTNSNLWKRTVYEDQLFAGVEGFEGWAGNQQVDTEDIGIDDGTGTIIGAGNGRIDWIDIIPNGEWDEGEPTEDLDSNHNGRVDTEDLDHNGILDAHNMLDHLAPYDLRSNQFGLFLTHQISERTFYELRFTRYYTRTFRNVEEVINEDIDGDGRLDDVDEWILTAHGDFQWVDLDGDGYFDRGNEDLNGNGALDEYGTDLFTDKDANDYVDASEIGVAPRDYYRLMRQRDPLSNWMPWGDIPYQGQKDTDGFYTYAAGTTWGRTAWYEDESSDYGLKFDIDSQVMESQRIRAGVDIHLKDIFRYDAEDAYGYGEKFNVKPYQFAGYVQNKMEYGGMILNIGLRYDYFNARWDEYPNNGRDPTWDLAGEVYFGGSEDVNSNGRLDPGEDLNNNDYLDQDWIAEKYQIGGSWEDANNNGILDAGEDLNGNGTLDFPEYLVYPGDIKDPRTVPSQDFISPRFGISYPITDNDKMYFSYGRYFSAPPGTEMYQNLVFDLGGGFALIGNPKLKPEKTTSYEAGIVHAFRNQSTLELKGFFKNITGLTATTTVYYTQKDWYGFKINGDYGTVRGFELTHTQRPMSLGVFQLGGVTTYTYQIARTRFSDSYDSYHSAWADDILPTEESYANWDQRHTLNINLDIRTGQRLGLLLGGWSTNLLYRYGSGTRWTPPKGQDRATLDNTRTLPEQHTVDVRFGKLMVLGGVEAELIIDVRNLLNRKNIVAIADEEWYALFDSDGDGKPDYDPQGKYNDPTVYSRGRLVRAGIQINF